MSKMGKVLPLDFIKYKAKGKKIAMVTAYTYFQAKIADEAGIDGILVGDSLGMVVMGYPSTLQVSMNEMKHHVRAVVNASPNALVVADMPFLSYEPSKQEAIENAGEFLRIGADAVKIEGGFEVVDKVEAMVKAGIPVMGHVGLNPQRYLVLGGYKVRGKKALDAAQIIESAKALEEAGVFSIVIENTTAEVGEEITKALKIPTICIGAGPKCDGQILVFHDVTGLNPNPPYFVRKYGNAYEVLVNSLARFADDVRKGAFPSSGEYKSMKEDELKAFKELIKKKESEL